MENKSEIKNKTLTYSRELVKFLQDLIRTKSANGEDFEEEIAKKVFTQAQELGLPAKLIAKNKRRPNIYLGDFSKFSSNKELLFIAHLDTVPVGDRSKWKHNPFSGIIEKGKLYGRGAIDCKAGIALSLYTLKILKDLGFFAVTKFVGMVDEESGADSDLGARYLLEKGLKAKSAIYTYPGVDTVTIGHRGLIRLWVEVYGEAAHSGSKSWQEKTKGANTIEALTKFLIKLPKLKMKGKHDAFPNYSFIQTPTLIEGGSGESIVPDKAKVLIDARLLPNQSNEEHINKIKQLAKKVENKKIKTKIKVKTNIPGAVISKNEAIVKILTALDKEVMGITPQVRGAGPASEGYMFIEKGIPTICGFGAIGDNAHSANEYVELNSLSQILEIYVRAAIDLYK